MTGRIRVLQLVTTRRPFFEQQVRALEQNGVSCRVLPVPGEGAKGDQRRSVSDYVRFYLRTVRETSGADFDLVHANYGLTCPAAIAQPKRPLVLSLWGSDLLGAYGPVTRACASAAEAVIVMSEEMADELDRECHVIPHGIDLDTFRPRPQSTCQRNVGWDENAKHVLFPYDPARTVKNYPRAKRVVAAVNDRLDQPVELHVVHDVNHDAVPTYMNAADALLLTSEHEGLPNAVKEALACNLPVVSVNVGGVADLLADLQHCHVHDVDSELERSLAMVMESERRTDGRSRAEKYGMRRMGEDIKSLYRTLLEDSASQG